jgi:histidinol-phosphatase (PHP family)
VAGHRPDAPEEWWDRLAEAAASAGMAAEVSSAGWRKPVGSAYPDGGLLERFARRGVPFTTASDAHRVDDVALRAGELADMVRAVGVHELRAYRGRVPHAVAIGSGPVEAGTGST